MARILTRIFIFSILCLLLTTCGLDVAGADMLYSPYDSGNASGGDDSLYNLFKFTTADRYNPHYLEDSNYEKGFVGTLVFYKIYDSATKMQSERASISSSNSQFSSNGANKALSLGYKQLKYYDSQTNKTVYYDIKACNVDKSVEIRFVKQGEYMPGIKEGGVTKTDGAGVVCVPYRVSGSSIKDFDFFNDDKTDAIPTDTDEDVALTENSDVDKGTYYVAGYAAAYGTNQYLNNIYSQLLSLGYIVIKDD